MKACNVILARERLDRERRKKAENRQARAEAEFSGQQEGGTPASFVVLAPNSVLHDGDTVSRGSPISSSAMLTPPESGESPIMGSREAGELAYVNAAKCIPNGNTNLTAANAYQAQTSQQRQNIVEGVWNRLSVEGNRTRDASTSVGVAHSHGTHGAEGKGAADQPMGNANQAAVDRQISVDVAKLVATFPSDDAALEEIAQPTNSIPYRGLDYDGLRALRQYVYGEEHGVSVDEEALLNQLEKTWREQIRADYHKMVENIPVFIARERAFLTWVELKRHLAALQRANESEWIIFSLIGSIPR